MTREEAKTVFLNRGYVKVENGTLYDPDKWREACVVISEWLEQKPQEKEKQEIKKNLDVIRAYLVENVFRNPDVMFSKDREKIDLPEIIASLYECLHRTIAGEPYLYMFHWANKIGSYVDDQLFVEDDK